MVGLVEIQKIKTDVDNEAFWRQLGMDIERHSVLMNVLPQVFQSVFQIQENRPKSIEYYDSVVMDIHGKRPKEVFDRKNNGDKVIGAFCTSFLRKSSMLQELCPSASVEAPTFP